MSADWGSIPDWFAAIGTVFGTTVIGGGLWYEVRRRRLDDESVRAQQRDNEANHARLVSVSFGSSPNHQHFEIRIKNDGDGPIRRIQYAILVTHADGEQDRLNVHDARGSGPGTVGARDSVEIEFNLPADTIDPSTPVEQLDVEARFLDLKGRPWRILAMNDELYRVHEDGAFHRVA